MKDKKKCFKINKNRKMKQMSKKKKKVNGGNRRKVRI